MKEPAGSPESTIADRAMPAVKSGETASQQVELHYQKIAGHWCCGTTKLADLHTGQEYQDIVSALESVREGESKQAIIPIDNGQFKSVFVLEIDQGLLVNRALAVNASDSESLKGSLQSALQRVGIRSQINLNGPILLDNRVDSKSLQTALEKTDYQIEVSQSDNLISQEHLLPAHPGGIQTNYENPLSDFMPARQEPLKSPLVFDAADQVPREKIRNLEFANTPSDQANTAKPAQAALFLTAFSGKDSSQALIQHLAIESPETGLRAKVREQSGQIISPQRPDETAPTIAEQIRASPIPAEKAQSGDQISLAERIVVQEQFERSIYGQTLAEITTRRSKPQADRTVTGAIGETEVTVRTSVTDRLGKTGGIDRTIPTKSGSQGPEVSLLPTNAKDPAQNPGRDSGDQFAPRKEAVEGSAGDLRTSSTVVERTVANADTRDENLPGLTEKIAFKEQYERTIYGYANPQKRLLNKDRSLVNLDSVSGKLSEEVRSPPDAGSLNEIGPPARRDARILRDFDRDLNQIQRSDPAKVRQANSRDRTKSHADLPEKSPFNLRNNQQKNILQPDSQLLRRAGRSQAGREHAVAEMPPSPQPETKILLAAISDRARELIFKNPTSKTVENLSGKSRLQSQLSNLFVKGGDQFARLAQALQTFKKSLDTTAEIKELRDSPRFNIDAQPKILKPVRAGRSKNKAEIKGSEREPEARGEELIKSRERLSFQNRIHNQLSAMFLGGGEQLARFIKAPKSTSGRIQRTAKEAEIPRKELKSPKNALTSQIAGELLLPAKLSVMLRQLARALGLGQAVVATQSPRSMSGRQSSELPSSKPGRVSDQVAEQMERLASKYVNKLGPAGKRQLLNHKQIRAVLTEAQSRLISELPKQTELKFNIAFKKFGVTSPLRPRFMIGVIQDLRLSVSERSQLFCLIRISKLLSPSQPYRSFVVEKRAASADAQINPEGSTYLQEERTRLLRTARQVQIIFSSLRQSGSKLILPDSQIKDRIGPSRPIVPVINKFVKNNLPEALENSLASARQSSYTKSAGQSLSSTEELLKQLRGSDPDQMTEKSEVFGSLILARIKNYPLNLFRSLRLFNKPDLPGFPERGGDVRQKVGSNQLRGSEIILPVAHIAGVTAPDTETGQSEKIIDESEKTNISRQGYSAAALKSVGPQNNRPLTKNLDAVKETLVGLQSGVLTEHFVIVLANLTEEIATDSISAKVTIQGDVRLTKNLRLAMSEDLDSFVFIQLMIASLILRAGNDRDKLKLLLREFSSFEQYLLSRELSSAAETSVKLKALAAVLKANKHSFPLCLEQVRRLF